jgi:hypothetical protein
VEGGRIDEISVGMAANLLGKDLRHADGIDVPLGVLPVFGRGEQILPKQLLHAGIPAVQAVIHHIVFPPPGIPDMLEVTDCA